MILRIDKFLADMGVGTRTEVKKIISKGRIKLNSDIVTNANIKVDTENDKVFFDGNLVNYDEFEYYMINKPAGVISASQDKKQKTVVDLIFDKKRKDLFPVGRLDKDTVGLLLVTNDGELSHNLLSPSKHVDKTYFAKVTGKIDESLIEIFENGFKIDEDFVTMPAKVVVKDYDTKENLTSIEITIKEGKYHQIKRMFEAHDMQVVYLKRLSMGSLLLDENLAEGEYRKLTAEELLELKKGR